MLAFGETGFGAGRCFGLIGNFGMAKSINSFLRHESFTANRAMTAFGETGFGAGRCFGLIGDFGMAESGTDFNTAYLAMACFGAGCTFGQGVVTERNDRLRHKDFAAGRAMRAFGKACGNTGGLYPLVNDRGMAQGSNGFVGFVATAAADDLFPCCSTARSREIFAAAGGIVNDLPTFPCGQGQGDLYISSRFLKQLIGYCLGTVLNFDCTVAGNVCTACGGVNISQRGIDGAVHLYLSIFEVCVGSGIDSAGGIHYGNKGLIGGAGVVAPIVYVINIHIVARAKDAFGIFANDNFRAGKEGDILIDGNIASHYLNGHITVDGQFVVFRVNAGGTYCHVDRGKGYITVGFYNEAVGGFVIVFYNVTTGQVEHCVLLRNKLYSRAKFRAGHIDGGIGIFLSAGANGQGHFDVLEIVLRQGEYAVFHIGGLCTATEVHNLEVFIDAGTVFCCNGACTVNIAVGIERTAIFDGDSAVCLHLDKADSTDGRAAPRLCTLGIGMLCGKANGTVDGEVSPFGHGQGTVSGGGSGLGSHFHTYRSGSIHSVGAVKGDK